LREVQLRGNLLCSDSASRGNLVSRAKSVALGSRDSSAPDQRRTGRKVGKFSIPSSELTPAVSAAISGLLNEISRLELFLQQTQSRVDELLRTADQDTLLPVLNRRALMREIARFIAFAERYGTQSSLLFLDIDGFKAINDVHGHSAGDFVLRQFCEFLANNTRGSDILARVGGDEFALIFPAVSGEQARRKGGLLAQALAKRSLVWNDGAVELSFSWGACELRGNLTADAAMGEADRNMYLAKRQARA
jgi:diguanylate cyclase (GGDEF)-like protein